MDCLYSGPGLFRARAETGESENMRIAGNAGKGEEKIGGSSRRPPRHFLFYFYI